MTNFIATTIDHIEPAFEKALIADVKNGTKLIQVLRELKKKWTDLLSPNTKDSLSTCTPEYYESVRVAITKGFSHTDRTCWETPTKELNDVDKLRKSNLGKMIGSKIKDLRKQLKKEQESSPERAEPRTPNELFLEYLNKAGTILEKNQTLYGPDQDKLHKKLEDMFDIIA